jgi:hypothetical protein
MRYGASDGMPVADVKAEKFAEWSIAELCFTRDEAADYRQFVWKRLGSPKLTRVFIMKELVVLRRCRGKAKAKQ